MDDGYSDGSRSSGHYGASALDGMRGPPSREPESYVSYSLTFHVKELPTTLQELLSGLWGDGNELARAWIPNIVAGLILFDLIVTCIDIDVMIVCIVVYTMEFALNTWLLKLKFLRELSTWLDAFVLICGWVELIIYQMGREDLYFFRDIRMLRVVRICRVANLVRKTRSLRELRKMMLLVELVNPLCCRSILPRFKTVIAGDSWGTIAVPIIEVTLSELIQGVRKAHPISFSRLLLDAVRRLKLFTRIDADGSGTVEAEEFVTPLSRSLVRPLWPALCRWVHDSKTATRFIKYNLMRTPSVSWASEGEVESPKSSALEWLQKATEGRRLAVLCGLPLPSNQFACSGGETIHREQADAEQPTDKIVTSTRLAEEDSLKAALVHAENLLVASNKAPSMLGYVMRRGVQSDHDLQVEAHLGVSEATVLFQHGYRMEFPDAFRRSGRSMSEEHSDAPTKQKPMAYSASDANGSSSASIGEESGNVDNDI
ncbi:unnamed protein product [Symbiodinium sp. KB8]|nr:unnamed protein product [Symbiodinium sp. KB8]